MDMTPDYTQKLLRELSDLSITQGRVIIRGKIIKYSKKEGSIEDNIFEIIGNPEEERIQEKTIVEDLITLAYKGNLPVNSRTKEIYTIESEKDPGDELIKDFFSNLVPWIERGMIGKIHPINEHPSIESIAKRILRRISDRYLYRIESYSEDYENEFGVCVEFIVDGVKIHKSTNRITLSKYAY